MSEFDFNIGNKSAPIVNLISVGLSFNEACISLLGYPKYIGIGLNKENKQLAVMPLKDDTASMQCYKFIAGEKKQKHVSVTAGMLRKEILKLINLESRWFGIKFKAEFDKDKNLLIVDLNKERL